LWRANGANCGIINLMFQPKFTITPEINNRVAEMARIKEVVNKSRILPEQEITLRYRAKVDAIHSSTSIEGNLLNKRQVQLVISGKSVRASERMITEAINYKNALDWLEKRSRKTKKISFDDILSLHRLTLRQLLPEEKVGNFRKGEIFIVDVINGKDVVRYIGPKGYQIRSLLEGLLTWLYNSKNNLHPILKAGIFHYEFVSIHPFSDGNGRVTRLLTLLYLWLNDYAFKKVLVPDVYYLQNRLAYYDALNRAPVYDVRHEIDITPWLDYFTKGFLAVARDLEAEITAFSLKDSGQTPVKLSETELLLVDFARQLGRIDLKEAINIINVPRRTAQRWLARLVAKKILKKHGKGKSIYYQLI